MDGLTGPRQWIYPQSVKGRFQFLHRWTGLVLQLILFVTPWLMVDGRPLVRIDLAARRLYLFGGVFTPSDTAFVAILGLGAAFALFFLTSLFGRLWCGYACPQTVFLEEWIRPIEKFFEGDRGQRMASDKKGWSARKVLRKAGKFSAFALVAGVTAMTLVSYFAGARMLWTGAGSAAAYALVAVFGGVMFADFAWFREQFCNYLCPYARFQGALSDNRTLAVTYDVARGEPRGQAGACIACNKCVTVCPQGIDIRDGFQLECINCARCVDACEGVMGKLHQPSLVGYATQSGKWTFLRGRTFVYGGLLAMIAVMGMLLAYNRHDLDGMVSRAPGSLFVVDADGWTRNTFLVRLSSKEMAPETYAVSVRGLPAEAEVIVSSVELPPGQSVTFPLIIRIPPANGSARTLPLEVVLTSATDTLSLNATFKTNASES